LDCNYIGSNNLNKALKGSIEEYKAGNLSSMCPEQLGGLPTPRSVRIRINEENC